jgi:hypothetical protein
VTWRASARIACLTMVALGCGARRSAPAAGDLGEAGAPFPPAFVCAGARCTQAYPRVPDDGEWTCAGAAGAALCVGGERAAGVAPAPADPAWACGPRRGRHADALGSKVCLDPHPDTPDGKPAGWRCWFVHDPPRRRVCERDASTPTLADGCDARRACVDGSMCVGGRCQLPAGPPDCWLNDDCDGRRCRLGRCDEASPSR